MFYNFPNFNIIWKYRTLTIVTRYDTIICEEFKERFLATTEAIALNITDIEFLQATTDEGWKKLLQDPSKSVDIAWGGGTLLFTKMDNLGLLYHINPSTDSDLFTIINTTVPYALAGSKMKELNEVGDLIWAANTIYIFGFLVNHDFLDAYGLPIPTVFEELATPTYYLSENETSIALLEPLSSSFFSTIFHVVLQNFGWEEGWKILTRIGANSEFYDGYISPREAVVDGVEGIAFTTDFYGRMSNRVNPSCEYIIPEGQAKVMADPIAIGKYVDDYDASVAFMNYIYSPEGLATWLIPSLDRLPVNDSAFLTPEGSLYTDLYELYNGSYYEEPLLFDETLAWSILDISKSYFHNTITINHDLLRTTWGELITHFYNQNISVNEFLDLSNTLGEPCLTMEDAINWNSQFATDSVFAGNLETAWKNCSEIQYQSVLDILTIETPTPTPSTPDTRIISMGLFTSIIALTIIRKKKKK
ncbi:MAG: ABC transporter substrate-binding protein [Candidatus Heimdallarchaeaceae archaeon]